MMYYQIFISTGRAFAQIGYSISVALYHVNDKKNKLIARGRINIGTNTAMKLTKASVAPIIEQKIEELGVEFKIPDVGKYNFDEGLKEKLIAFMNSILEDFVEINIGNPDKIKEYGVVVAAPQSYIIIFKQKYGTRYFVVNKPEDASKVFLKILIERNTEGWFDWMKNHVPLENSTNSIRPTYTLEDIEKLPESMKGEVEKMKKEVQRWNRYDSESKAYRETYASIQESINNNDGDEAYRIFSLLKDGEYDGYEITQGEEY